MSKNDAPARARPLSPHLQIYRWPVTMLSSILHRGTGIALYSGTLFLTIWLLAAAVGPSFFDQVAAIYASPLGLVVTAGYSWALFYHLLNGVRHLNWDAGLGFEISQANASATLVLVGSFVLTGLLWAVVLFDLI